MADVNEELIKEAIKKATEKAEAEKAAADKAAGNAKQENAEAETASEEAEKVSGEVEDTAEAQADDGDAAKECEGCEASEGTAEGESKKKGLFGKKDKKDKRDEQIADLNDKLLRNLAEFENFRKRSEKEKAQMFEIGAKSIVEKILPTIDNFERGLATVPEDKKDDPFVQGIEKVYKQFLAALEDAGVKPIEAVGKEFDPKLHNAVMHEDNDAFGENTVSAELQKGYMYHDTVVRHSMVKVAN